MQRLANISDELRENVIIINYLADEESGNSIHDRGISKLLSVG